jgi:hypothetical protein
MITTTGRGFLNRTPKKSNRESSISLDDTYESGQMVLEDQAPRRGSTIKILEL